MRVEVLVFGAAAATARADRVAVEVGDAPTVRDVLRALHEQHPLLRFALPSGERGRLAVNGTFAGGDHPIRLGRIGEGGDEVALVTLVGGG